MESSLEQTLAAGLPRLVIFDIDGTLTDTGVWWPPLARRGVAALAAELGEALPAPEDDQANSLLGLARDDLWAGLLPESARDHWKRLRALTLPMEGEVLREGTDHTFPGTRELLSYLRQNGVAIALASNCGTEYLEGVLEGQRIGELVDRAWCAESPGIGCKADMVAAALTEFETRDAVLVGDREGDCRAAQAHALPFILRTGWHGEGDLPAEAVARSQEEIGLWLSSRGTFLRLLQSRVGVGRVGVTGPPGVGKSLFAAALARALGCNLLLSLDDYLPSESGLTDPPGLEGDHLVRAVDLEALLQDIGERDEFVLEGIFLEDPRLRSQLDVVVHLVAPGALCEERLRKRDGEEAAQSFRESWLPAYLAFPAHGAVDSKRIQVELSNALRPRLITDQRSPCEAFE